MTSPQAINADVNLLMLSQAIADKSTDEQRSAFLTALVAALCCHVDEERFASAVYAARCVYGDSEVIQ